MKRGSTIGGVLIVAWGGIATGVLGLPIWVLLAVLLPFALWWVWPQRPQLCHMCERDNHAFHYDERCLADYCHCDATIDTPVGGGSR